MSKTMLNLAEMSLHLGVSKDTLRRWEREGKITSLRTPGGHRRYEILDINKNKEEKYSIAYARVSTHGQKADLERQKQMLELYCSSKGYKYELIEDIGSGLNYNKTGLKKLINLIEENKIDRIVLTHKDRLMRFGFGMISQICSLNNVLIDVINIGEEKLDNEKEFVNDVLEIITVFSARLYGKRSHKNKKILEENKKLFNGI
ncbi:MAG: IS607 family transposase [Candidatus Izemoplasmatales bacterium]